MSHYHRFVVCKCGRIKRKSGLKGISFMAPKYWIIRNTKNGKYLGMTYSRLAAIQKQKEWGIYGRNQTNA